jgi:flagellar assembly factor FliW
MLKQNDATNDVRKTAKQDILRITSRFGDITLDLTKKIYFPNGMLGMEDNKYFCLTNFPNKNYDQFKLLQSTEEVELSFITLPIDFRDNKIMDEEDIELSCVDLGFSTENIVVLLIVSTYHHPGGKKIDVSVNARAPLIIDISKNQAVQYVLKNDKYKVRHMLCTL